MRYSFCDSELSTPTGIVCIIILAPRSFSFCWNLDAQCSYLKHWREKNRWNSNEAQVSFWNGERQNHCESFEYLHLSRVSHNPPIGQQSTLFKCIALLIDGKWCWHQSSVARSLFFSLFLSFSSSPFLLSTYPYGCPTLYRI